MHYHVKLNLKVMIFRNYMRIFKLISLDSGTQIVILTFPINT